METVTTFQFNRAAQAMRALALSLLGQMKWRHHGIGALQQSDVQARLLYPIEHPPVMAFGHDMDSSLIDRVVGIARRQLSAGMGS